MKSQEIQHIFHHYRSHLTALLAENLQDLPRWEMIWCDPKEREGFLKFDVAPFVDYLSLFLQTGREEYFWLYFGEKHRQVFESGIEKERIKSVLAQIIEQDQEDFHHILTDGPDVLKGLVQDFFQNMLKLLNQPVIKKLCALFIGDCLYTDVLDFLVPMCLAAGISLDYDRITTKNPVEQHESVRQRLEAKEYDLISYSPFSYAATREYELLLSLHAATMSRHQRETFIERLITHSTAMINVITEMSEVPLFVHLASGIKRRETSVWRHRMGQWFIQRSLRQMIESLNEALRRHAEAVNASTFERVFLVDELEWAGKDGWRPRELEEFLYHGFRLHTARLGTVLAKEYFAACFVAGFLRPKKVIVCDCDNTLWEGVIGEGSVRPYVRRQQILKELKERGLLLAVNSKNNPHDVRWDGQILNEKDFVAAAINWAPKTDNMTAIAKELNLKVKDFVFLDDSHLERELMKAQRPEVVTMDAADPLTWRILEHWIGWRPKEERSRTQLYHEEKKRKGVLLHAPNSGSAPIEALKGLQMNVMIRRAERSDLKRVMELINRTNQFNLCGTRVRYRELEDWLVDPMKCLIAAELRDRFGDFGIVCAVLIERGSFGGTYDAKNTTTIRMPVFVMSCRVIGYGVDTAVLNAIKKIVFNQQGEILPANRIRLIGCYRATAHNQPCAGLYEKNGFVLEAQTGEWICLQPTPKDIPWLEINDKSIAAFPRDLAVVKGAGFQKKECDVQPMSGSIE